MLHFHGASFHIVAWRGDIDAAVRSNSQCSAHRALSSMSKLRPSTPEDVRRAELYGDDVTVWESVKELVQRAVQAVSAKVERARSRTPSPLPQPPSDLFVDTSSSSPTSDPFRYAELMDMPEVATQFEEMSYATELLGNFPQPPSRTAQGAVNVRLNRPQKTKLRERIRGRYSSDLRPVPESIVMSFRASRLYDMF